MKQSSSDTISYSKVTSDSRDRPDLKVSPESKVSPALKDSPVIKTSPDSKLSLDSVVSPGTNISGVKVVQDWTGSRTARVPGGSNVPGEQRKDAAILLNIHWGIIL